MGNVQLFIWKTGFPGTPVSLTICVLATTSDLCSYFFGSASSHLVQQSRCARVQAGMTGPELEAELRKHDLTLRHYPQSFEFATVGGWVATRSGGEDLLNTSSGWLSKATRVI